MSLPRLPLVETARIALDPEEHAKLGELIRAAEAAKLACTTYIDQLGTKYAIYAGSADCSIGFETGYAVIKEASLVVRAS